VLTYSSHWNSPGTPLIFTDFWTQKPVAPSFPFIWSSLLKWLLFQCFKSTFRTELGIFFLRFVQPAEFLSTLSSFILHWFSSWIFPMFKRIIYLKWSPNIKFLRGNNSFDYIQWRQIFVADTLERIIQNM
jgi:hypothetical protein